MNPVEYIPYGHCAKGGLAENLKVGNVLIQNLSKLPDFPAPAGYYVSQNKNKRVLPYYNIQRVRRFVGKHYDFKPEPQQSTGKESLQNASPWAVPAHTKQERRACVQVRQFLTLIRTNYEPI